MYIQFYTWGYICLKTYVHLCLSVDVNYNLYMIKITNKFTPKSLFFVLVFMLLSTNLFAFQFSPLSQEFEPSGPNATKTYTVINDSNEPIAIEMKALRRDMDSFGNEVNSDASAYFSVQPNKFIVKPKETMLVRVQYRGPQTVSSELPFRIKAEQIQYSKGKPTGDEANQSTFNFLYTYISSAYVKPMTVTEKVVVSSISKNEDGELAIKLVNAGTVHQILDNLHVTIKDSNGHIVELTDPEQLSSIYGMNLLARKTVLKNIPWPEGLDKDSSYKANIKYTSIYQNVI